MSGETFSRKTQKSPVVLDLILLDIRRCCFPDEENMEGCHRDHDVKDVCGGPRMVIRPPVYAPDPPPMAASLFSFQCLVPKERLFSVIHGVLGDIPLHPPFTPELGNERVREELPCRWSPAWVSLQALADEEAELSSQCDDSLILPLCTQPNHSTGSNRGKCPQIPQTESLECYMECDIPIKHKQSNGVGFYYSCVLHLKCISLSHFRFSYHRNHITALDSLL
uniref:Uncharacterized protein n=1 Tax=Xenopus tropicalis TaxID=8364 RepID=A0A1B8XVX3_XENTR